MKNKFRKYIITPVNRFIEGFKAFRETYKTEPWDGWDTLILICGIVTFILLTWATIVIIPMIKK